jgi:predicted ATPase
MALSAHQEAISLLTRALALLAELPNTVERTREEVRLYTDLGISYKITKGYAADEVEGVYRRAKILSVPVGDSLTQASVLWGYHGVYAVRGELAASYASAQECLALAQDDPILLVTGHLMAGASLSHMGRLRAAQSHLERAREAYSPQQHGEYTFLAGFDLGVFTLAHFAHVLGYLGHPDQALRLAQEALELAQSLAHTFSQVVALSYLTMLHQLCSDWRAVQAVVASTLRLCVEYDTPYYLAWNNFLQGWALTEQARVEQGIGQMEQSLAEFQAVQAGLRRPYYLGLLAEAYGKVGRLQDGLRLTEEALAQGERQEQRAYESDVQRVRGELLRQDGAPTQEVETSLHHAIESAQQREAKLPELRAVTNLARLYQAQGKRDAALHILAPAVAWFSEGLALADLQAARRLLDTLR